MTVAIDVSELSVHYRGAGRPVLDELSVRIEASTFLGVLGPSGCGKSTLLNCIAGFVRPTTGAVTCGGAVVAGPARERGMVFQRDVLFPWASVAGNIGFALRSARVPRRRRRDQILSLVDRVGLDSGILDRLPHELSGGMRQRVGIARSLAGSPRVLLMDEPFGALDALTRQQMQDLITDLWEHSQITIVFVTHDVDEAIRIASSILVMDASGAIVAHLPNPIPRPRPAANLADFQAYPGLRRTLHELLRTPQ